MRGVYSASALALVASMVITLVWAPMSFEQRLIAIQSRHAPAALLKALEDEPDELKAVVLGYAQDELLSLKAQAALIRYPALSRRIFPLYGTDPDFQAVLAQYGEDALLPIGYFLDNEVLSIALMRSAARGFDSLKAQAVRFRLWKGASTTGPPPAPEDSRAQRLPGAEHSGADQGEAGPGVPPPTHGEGVDGTGEEGALSPEQRGWYAVGLIKRQGYDFLGQFVLDGQGAPRWVQSERFMEGAGSFFGGGIRDLETKARRDEAIVAADLGWAAVDTFAMVGALKLLRLGKAVSASGRSAQVARTTATLTSRVARAAKLAGAVVKNAKWPALVLSTYVVVTHPGLINDTLAGVAAMMGLPPWVGQWLGWMVILFPIFYLGAWIMRWLIRPSIGVLRLMVRPLSQYDDPKRTSDGDEREVRGGI